jgi:hypothetical protein
MKPGVLVLFLDGIGLADDDPISNPFVSAHMPTLERLLEGRRMLRPSAPFEGMYATLLALDANLGLDGLPQSATGQASLMSGQNVPALIGEHYGPKPNAAVAEVLGQHNLIRDLRAAGHRAALLNAYPPPFFEAIESGKRLHSSIQLTFSLAGVPLRTSADLQIGRAMAADFTGRGWAEQSGFPPTPIYSPGEAGGLLARLASQVDLSWFDYWISDYVGHRGTLEQAIEILEVFDAVLGGLVEAWHERQGLIVITSDHGNMEQIGIRNHTRNPVPGLLIGPADLRARFAHGLHDLTGIAPAIMNLLQG